MSTSGGSTESATTLASLSEDLRDNTALLALVDSLETDQGSDGRGSIGLGMASAIDNSATVSGVTLRGGGFDLRTGTDANAQSLISSKQLSTYGDRNPHFIAILTSRAANSALKAQGWGFIDTAGDDISNWTATDDHKAFFRSVTTGNLFAVSGNGSNEQTTDLGSSHTLGSAGVFEVFTTDDGSTWLFHIAKTLVATHSTQVPTATTAMKVRVGIENNTTTDLRITNIDLIMAYQDRS